MSQGTVSKKSTPLKLDELAKDTGVALLIKLSGIVLTYLAEVILAQWMGKTQYGIYVYVISWSLLLAIPAGLGLPPTVIRFVSKYKVEENWARLRGTINSSLIITFLTSIVLCLSCTELIVLLEHAHRLTYPTIPLIIGISLIPLQAFSRLLLNVCRSFDHIVLGYTPSQIIWPILVILSGFFLLKSHHQLTAEVMIGAASLILFIALIVQFFLLQSTINREIDLIAPEYVYKELLDVSFVVLLQTGIINLLEQTDVLMIGSVLGPEEAGIYGAAVKTSLWVALILQTVNMIIAPVFATLHAQGDMEGLQDVVSKAAVWICGPSLGVATVLLIFSQPILGLFGQGFMVASLDLKILVLGQIANTFCGSVGILMVMTGHQDKSVKVFAWSAVLNIIGNAIAIPLFGRVGAAIATSLTMILWNSWLSTLVVKEIGIRTSIFYRPDQSH